MNTLDRARLELAARCDHPAARLALPEVPVGTILPDFLGQAERVDPLVGVVVAAAIAVEAAQVIPAPHLGHARDLAERLEEFVRSTDRERARELDDLRHSRRGPTRTVWIHAWQGVIAAAGAPWAWCAPMRSAALAAQQAQNAYDAAIRTGRGAPSLTSLALLGRIRERLGAWATA